MNFSKRRKQLSEITPGAYRGKLGDLLPEVIRVKLASADISSGVATVDIGEVSGKLCAILVKSDAGAIRAVTAFSYDAGTAEVTATSVAAGDTVTMMFI
mgnify:CR=1 FL=1